MEGTGRQAEQAEVRATAGEGVAARNLQEEQVAVEEGGTAAAQKEGGEDMVDSVAVLMAGHSAVAKVV